MNMICSSCPSGLGCGLVWLRPSKINGRLSDNVKLGEYPEIKTLLLMPGICRKCFYIILINLIVYIVHDNLRIISCQTFVNYWLRVEIEFILDWSWRKKVLMMILASIWPSFGIYRCHTCRITHMVWQ